MSEEPGALAKKPQKKGITVTWRGIVLILAAVALLVFAVQNLQTAPVNFLGATVDVWVWLVVVSSFLLGMLLGGVVKAGARKLRKPKPPQSKA
jgi:uncharacterized integral membrane protein